MTQDLKREKRVNLVLPNIPDSNFLIQLRKDNQKLIQDLERLEQQSFGIWRYLRLR